MTFIQLKFLDARKSRGLGPHHYYTLCTPCTISPHDELLANSESSAFQMRKYIFWWLCVQWHAFWTTFKWFCCLPSTNQTEIHRGKSQNILNLKSVLSFKVVCQYPIFRHNRTWKLGKAHCSPWAKASAFWSQSLNRSSLVGAVTGSLWTRHYSCPAGHTWSSCTQANLESVGPL